MPGLVALTTQDRENENPFPNFTEHVLYKETINKLCGDCHLMNNGSNDKYGVFRPSGCAACHLPYDYSALDQKPEYNPVIEQLFGRRTDINPTAASLSPRIGFNLRMSRQENGNFNNQAKNLSGGIGLFAGRAPTNIYSTAVRQTGLPSAEQTLSCIGDAVPVPDWDLYMADPSQVPSTCVDGGLGGRDVGAGNNEAIERLRLVLLFLWFHFCQLHFLNYHFHFIIFRFYIAGNPYVSKK